MGLRPRDPAECLAWMGPGMEAVLNRSRRLEAAAGRRCWPLWPRRSPAASVRWARRAGIAEAEPAAR